MKNEKIIKQSLAFLVLLVVTLIVVNFAYKELVLEKSAISRQLESFDAFLEDHPDKHISYGFFGDSHPYNDVVPTVIDEDAFNFASTAENYFFSYYRFEHLIEEKMVSFDTVVLGFDYHSFSGALLEDKFILDRVWWQKQHVPLRTVKKNFPDIGCFELWQRANMYFFGQGEDFFTNPPQSYIDNGWVKFNPDYASRNFTDFAQLRYEIHYKGYERIHPLQMDYFMKFLDLAEEHNISVVLVKYPFSVEYAAMLDKYNLSSEKYYVSLERAIVDAGFDVTILDYHDVFLDRPNYFANPDHLLEEGATAFSLLLKEDLAENT